jgi:class 3 adenylate cyclase/pimeloyl-ACP methyl ester carboxylesterase
MRLPSSAGGAQDRFVEIRDTRYAKTSDGVYIAYQTNGDGPTDLVCQLDFFGNVDVIWEAPIFGRLFTALARFSRLILHDRRATGLSSRNVPVPNLETRAADLVHVLDAVGSDRPVLCGAREGGSPNALLAATDPERVRSLVWFSPSVRSVWTPDYPWGVRPEYVELEQRALDVWGTAAYGQAFLETEASEQHELPEALASVVGLLSRHTTTPDVARDLSRVWFETDIRDVVRSVHVPTLLIAFEDPPEEAAEAEYIAALMPEATLRLLPGDEASADQREEAALVRDFIGVDQPADLDSVLSTVLFTDIIGSTEKQAALGDHRWKELIEDHHALVRDALARYRGVENDTAGDGFYATFDGPARAIRCALEVRDRVRNLGVEIRAGVHTGECEVIDGKIGGIAVTIGARIAATTGASEVRISQTVKDLVAGSGLTFEDAGEHELKGVPDHWRLYRVVSAA